MTIQKIKAGRITSVVADEYVGDAGTIFYNQDLGDLRLSDGVTIGGILLNLGSSGSSSGGGNASIIVSSIPPSSATTGTMWWNSSNSNLYIRYANTWRIASTTPGPQGPIGPQGPAGTNGTSIVIKGSVVNVIDLPLSNNTLGDLYVVTSLGDGYFWNDTSWQSIGAFRGPKGDTGDTGLQGPQGSQGIQGPKGDTGDTGPQGPRGLQGIQGDTGPQGEQGVRGPQGDIGLTGPIGPQGIQGIKGDIGSQGPQGIQGDIGLTGPIGPQGIKGDIGSQGPQGIQGDIGLTGPIGPQGIKGDIGSQGPQGDIGLTGPIGPQGIQGIQGIPGSTYTLPVATADTLGGIKVGAGLTITEDGTLTNDRVYEFSQIIRITADWQDVGVNADQIATGTYIVQVKANDYAVGGGHHSEYYSATMSWFGQSTNSTIFDEVALHRAGNGPGSGALFLRVQRTDASSIGKLKLQIAGITDNTSSSLYVFRLRLML